LIDVAVRRGAHGHGHNISNYDLRYGHRLSSSPEPPLATRGVSSYVLLTDRDLKYLFIVSPSKSFVSRSGSQQPLTKLLVDGQIVELTTTTLVDRQTRSCWVNNMYLAK
jgi:hypothetical protein